MSTRRRALPAKLLALVGVVAAVAGLGSAQAGASNPAALKAATATSWPNGPDPCAIPCGTLTNAQLMGLISLMSVSEENTLIHLGGSNVNGNAGSVASVERVGIPPWHWTDGPAGVRLGSQETAMPNPASLISSWDQSMGNLYGHTVGLDARATTQDGWYAPMMNQVAIPTAGRNFETSGEDPYLAGQMVVGEVQGAQGSGFVTELKHYVDNDFENSRTSTSVYVDERTLHEGEMQSFEAGIHAGALAVMCSYNRLNVFVTPPAPGVGDIYACSNNYTLNQVLKGRLPFGYSQLAVPPALGFTGNVGSDYGATHVPSDLINGLDTEQSTSSSLGAPVRNAIGTCSAGNAIPCNGPGTAAVPASADFPAVPAYTADQWKMAMDNAVFHALQMYNAAGYLEGTPYGTLHAPNCIPANLMNGATADCADVQPTRSTVAALDPTSRAAAQTVAERGAVLLKNATNILPLKCSDFTGNGVLVMGPTAFAPYTGGGGSAHVTPKPNVQSPYDALVAAATAKCGGTPVIKSTFGSLTSATIDGWPVPTHGGSATDPSSNPGLLRTQASSGTVVAPGTAVTPCTPGAGCIAPSDDQTVNYTDPNNAVLAPGTGWVWQGSVTAPATDGPWVLRVCYANNAASATNGAIQLFAKATPFGGPPASTDRVINVTGAYADQSGASQTGQCHSPGGAKQNVTATGAGTGIASGSTVYIELRAISNGTSPLRLQLVWAPTTGSTGTGTSVQTSLFQTEATTDATTMAAGANKVLDFVYDDGTEGSDRGGSAIANGLALVAAQNTVAAADIAANANTAVVLNTGDSVFMPWASSVNSLLEMWYPGQQGGAATADVLLGTTDPGGHLPMTFYDGNAPIGQRFPQDTQPAACEDNTANYGQSGGSLTSPTAVGQCPMYPGIYTPNNLGTVLHGFRTINFSNQVLGGVQGNGIFVGYKWFDQNGYTPLFPFGYGLSYTTFAFSNETATPSGDGVDVSFDVKNTGSVAGDQVAQVYVGAPAAPPVPFAVRALGGFQRVSLNPGQTQHLTIHLAPRAFQYWDVGIHNWQFATGARQIYVGWSSRDLPLSAAVTSYPFAVSTVGATVSSVLSLSLGSVAPAFGTFIPGVAATYNTTLGANITTTAAASTLTAQDTSATFTGHLVNNSTGGPYQLPQGVAVDATSTSPSATGGGVFTNLATTNPATVLSYTAPVSNDAVTLGFQQQIGATDPLRTGAYSKTITYTLSTSTP